MPNPKKPRPTTPAPSATTTESKAAAEFRRFKAASAAAAPGASALPTAPAANAAPAPMPGLPPFFSLPGSAQGWAMLPQPGMVQPAPLAMGPIGDRLGSTLRLGIDVLNMALAGSLRMLGSMGYGGQEQGCGCQCGCGGPSRQGSCCGNDCGCGYEQDCCTPSVGSCCH
jgi:hypothetical protein